MQNYSFIIPTNRVEKFISEFKEGKIKIISENSEYTELQILNFTGTDIITIFYAGRQSILDEWRK